MIAAILRAQFLSMRLGATRGAALGWITAVIWYGFWTVAALFAGAFTAQLSPDDLRTALPAGFLAVCLYWQIVPIVSASMGSGLDLRKLLAYPVPHARLFVVEVLLRIVTALEMLLVVTGGGIGLLLNHEAGGLRAFPRIAAGSLLFVLFNVLLASGTRSVLERLLSRKRVREVVAVFAATLWVLPRFLMATGFQAKSLGRFGVAVQTAGLPWSAAASAMFGGAVPLLSLCAWTALAGWFGRRQFERNLRYDPIAAQASAPGAAPARNSWTERLYRLPGLLWRDPLAGIVEKELRSLARTPRFRMVFVMGFTFGLLVWFPMMVNRRAGHTGASAQYFLPVVAAYALTLLGQVSYLNCFGFDRSAAAFYFASPQPIAKVIAGKNVAAMCFILIEVVILAGVTMALGVARGLPSAAETLIVTVICSLYLLAIGNISSVNYPRALNPERVGQGGASSRFQGLIFLLYPFALLPVFLAYLARYAFESEIAFAIVLAIAAAIGAVVYWLAMDSAVRTAMVRREQIVQELSKGDGPIASD
jgi:ABC-2 type transport system permease protein